MRKKEYDLLSFKERLPMVVNVAKNEVVKKNMDKEEYMKVWSYLHEILRITKSDSYYFYEHDDIGFPELSVECKENILLQIHYTWFFKKRSLRMYKNHKNELSYAIENFLRKDQKLLYKICQKIENDIVIRIRKGDIEIS